MVCNEIGYLTNSLTCLEFVPPIWAITLNEVLFDSWIQASKIILRSAKVKDGPSPTVPLTVTIIEYFEDVQIDIMCLFKRA